MGDVIVVFRIMPENPDKVDETKKSLEELKPQRLEEEEIAFGLKALIFTTIIPDEEGTIDKLENDLKRAKNVKSVESVTVSRSL